MRLYSESSSVLALYLLIPVTEASSFFFMVKPHPIGVNHESVTPSECVTCI